MVRQTSSERLLLPRLKATQIELHFDARPYSFGIRDIDWSKRARVGTPAALAGQCWMLVLPNLNRFAQGDIACQFALCRGLEVGTEPPSRGMSSSSQSPSPTC